MSEFVDYRLYENVAKLIAEVDVLKEYTKLLEERIKKLEEKK